MKPVFTMISYGKAEREWLKKTSHYLANPPPGCLFAIGVSEPIDGLFGPVFGGDLLGMCIIGRPVARALPQDGSCGEVVRMWLAPGLPYGTASEVLKYAALLAEKRGIKKLFAYHERGRHTGCIYKKAGFKKDIKTKPKVDGWGSRPNRASAQYDSTSKRRWTMELSTP
tara:strand:+ start:1155 stop:1661 length:507 start_codon:yes stop_codon:yes gene_type:complete